MILVIQNNNKNNKRKNNHIKGIDNETLLKTISVYNCFS